MSGRVIIMAGGTGGHIYPGLAVAEALRSAGVAVTWLGADGGMELDKVPAAGIEIDSIPIRGLRGKGLGGWLMMPARLGRAVGAARGVLKDRRPDCAVSFGGYVAGPGGLAAWLDGTPLVVHEQNRIPGLTNKSLAKVAKTVLQAFEGALPGARTVGNPVRAEVADLPEPDVRWAERAGPGRLLITGGSQGARALNQMLPEALAQLPQARRPHVRHQAGGAAAEETRRRYAELGVMAEVSAFIDDMAAAYGWADLVVCRSGALTISELAAAGVGAMLIPFPHAVDDHQTANAKVLVSVDAALLVSEGDLDAKDLATHLDELLSDRARTLALANAARHAAVADAAQSVAMACQAFLPGQSMPGKPAQEARP